MLHVVAAALGLSLIVAQSANAFNLVKYAGAAYLIYMGVRLLMRKDPAPTLEPVSARGARRALMEGIVVEALNVKTALFFLAFLPQFVATGQPMVPQLVMLGSICVALNTIVDVIAVMAADRLLKSSTARAARARLDDPDIRRYDACAGRLPGAGAARSLGRYVHPYSDSERRRFVSRISTTRPLLECPDAFASSYEEEADTPITEVAMRLEPSTDRAVYGLFIDGNLAGVIGLGERA